MVPISPELRPVLIGGCPRSGTTLLGAILGAHSQCACVPESGFKTDALRGQTASGDPRAFLRAICGSHHFALWGLDHDPDLHRAGGETPSFAAVITSLVRRYAESVDKWPVPIWIDHTPWNVCFGVTLTAMFPDVKFIHLVRDGRAVAASVLALDWGPGSAESAARWWSRLVTLGLALESWIPDRVLRVRFEDVVRAPETTVRGIAAFLGLDYEPGMLRGDGFRFGFAKASHALIGRPPQAARADAWTTSLSPRQIEIFESLAGDHLRCLGYDLLRARVARPPSGPERLAAAIRDRCKYWLREQIGARRRRARERRLAARRSLSGRG
jgi:hypothetical protein